MKLTYLYQPVTDLAAAVAFYRDTLGLDEKWREGETTAAFGLPGSEIELMLDVPPGSGPEWGAGAFFGVDDVAKFLTEHPELKVAGETIDIPGGKSVTILDPAGNALHLFDQSTAEE